MEKYRSKKNIHQSILFTFLIFLSSAFNGNCQLIVDAGPDQVVCINLYNMDTIYLGGNPTAYGGSGIYLYCWETLYHLPYSQYYWYASDILDDTSSANPKLINAIGSELVFHLTVQDEKKISVIDSCRIIFSKKMYSLMEYDFYVPRGDSTILCYDNLIGSNLPLDSIAWIPQTGVSSPHAPCTWVHPDTSTSYAVYIKDTAGCYGTSAPAYHIYIVPAVLDESISNPVRIAYDPYKKILNINGMEEFFGCLRLSLYDLGGKLILDEILTHNVIPLYNIHEPMVIYALYNEQKMICSGKLILCKN